MHDVAVGEHTILRGTTAVDVRDGGLPAGNTLGNVEAIAQNRSAV